MFDALKSIGDIFTTILDFFHGIIDTITSFIDAVSSWWDAALTILGMMPKSIVAICVAAFALLLAFIIIEILRDFL